MGFDQRRMARGNDIAAYSPLDDSPYAWWDASLSTLYSDAGTTVVTADGASVHRWSDLSGNARHLNVAGSGNRPTIQTGELNGLPVLRFDGTDDTLSVASVALSTFGIIVVMDNNGADQLVYAHGSASVDGSYLQSQAGRTIQVWRSTATLKSERDVTPLGWGDAWCVACHRYNGTNATNLLSVNGTLASYSGNPAADDPGTSTITATFWVGSNAGANNFFNGDIHAVCVLTPFDADKIGRVIDYYLDRTGIV